jgi:hypothetical protein
MAYNFVRASSQYLGTLTAPATDMPLTMAAWINPTGAPESVVRAVISINNPNAADGSRGSYRLVIPANTTVFRAVQQISGAGGSFALADTASGAVIAGQWQHSAAVFSSASSRTIYASTTSSVTTTTTATVPVVERLLIGGAELPAIGSYMNGLIAEVGIWNAALTDVEINSLAKGMACDKVRPQSLVFYAPLARDLIDVRGGLAITNNNTATVANHTRIYQ